MSHILEVRGLQVAFAGERGNTIGTDRIDFFVDQGETVCLVGESGCGKSITSLAVMGLLGRGGRVSQGAVHDLSGSIKLLKPGSDHWKTAGRGLKGPHRAGKRGVQETGP